jgi:integrase
MSAGTGREVDLPGRLIEALSEWKARTPRSKSNHPVFVSRSGRRQMVTNVDHRLKTAIRHANEQLVKDGIEPISERVIPHALRRTYASLRAALRDDLVYIAEQLRHTGPSFHLPRYQTAAKRRERLSGRYLDAFAEALDWAKLGKIGTEADVGRAEGLRNDGRISLT